MIRTIILILAILFTMSCQSDYKLNIINDNLKPNNTNDMVLIKGGNAIIGNDNWFEKGHKERVVNIPTFYIDKFEVSNKDYNTCFQKKICKHSIYYGMKEVNNPLQPVVGVSFNDAITFCKWLGKRLPTEEEWEKAARGPKGNIYPWGNDKITCEKAVYGSIWSKDCNNKKLKYPQNINSHPKSKSYYGLYNMVGNVWEWVDSEYIVEYFNKPKESNVSYKVIKGGSFGSEKKFLFAYSRRWEREYQATIGTGFRCAKDINP